MRVATAGVKAGTLKSPVTEESAAGPADIGLFAAECGGRDAPSAASA
jgi:hypothetical protein